MDGVGEGKALGKRRGLREDRRLRVRALQSGVWGAEETARAAGGAVRRRRGLACGARARGRADFFFIIFFSGPMRRRTSLAWALWVVGGGGTA